MNGVSVIVCCYNSSARLPETIRHLAAQKIRTEIPWEVIVVDNASTDNTSEAALHDWGLYKGTENFKIVNEFEKGLSFARLRGIQEAQFDILVFCDDDNWLREDFLINAFEIMRSDSTIGVLGGQIKELLEISDNEVLFRKYFDFSTDSNFCSGEPKRGFIHGAGMVIRKSIFTELQNNGFKSSLTDRKGNEGDIASGGDVELCYAVKLLGYKLMYSDRLSLQHFIPSSRLRIDYLKKLSKGVGVSNMYLNVYKWVLQNKNAFYLNLFQCIYMNLLWLISNSIKLFFLKKSEMKMRRIIYNESLKGALHTLLSKHRELHDLQNTILRLRSPAGSSISQSM